MAKAEARLPALPEDHSCDMSKLNRSPKLDHTKVKNADWTSEVLAEFKGYHCPVCRQLWVQMTYNANGAKITDWRRAVRIDRKLFKVIDY